MLSWLLLKEPNSARQSQLLCVISVWVTVRVWYSKVTILLTHSTEYVEVWRTFIHHAILKFFSAIVSYHPSTLRPTGPPISDECLFWSSSSILAVSGHRHCLPTLLLRWTGIFNQVCIPSNEEACIAVYSIALKANSRTCPAQANICIGNRFSTTDRQWYYTPRNGIRLSSFAKLRSCPIRGLKAKLSPSQVGSRLRYPPPSTEFGQKDGTWLREISSCSWVTALPGPAWLLLNKICTPFSRSLYYLPLASVTNSRILGPSY